MSSGTQPHYAPFYVYRQGPYVYMVARAGFVHWITEPAPDPEPEPEPIPEPEPVPDPDPEPIPSPGPDPVPDPDPDPTPDPEPDPEPPPEPDELRPGVAGLVLTHGEAFFSGGGQWWVKLNIVTLDAYNVGDLKSLRWCIRQVTGPRRASVVFDIPYEHPYRALVREYVMAHGGIEIVT